MHGKRFTEEQIEWMKEQRRMGRAYEQIANDFPNKYLGEEKPSASSVYNHTHKVQVLVEEEIETFEETTELPPCMRAGKNIGNGIIIENTFNYFIVL